jgi:hypothetical protein
MSDNQDYSNGFIDGWNAACKAFGLDVKKEITEPYKFDEGCSVCGIGKNGDPFGYVCQHPNCPTKTLRE